MTELNLYSIIKSTQGTFGTLHTKQLLLNMLSMSLTAGAPCSRSSFLHTVRLRNSSTALHQQCTVKGVQLAFCCATLYYRMNLEHHTNGNLNTIVQVARHGQKAQGFKPGNHAVTTRFQEAVLNHKLSILHSSYV